MNEVRIELPPLRDPRATRCCSPIIFLNVYNRTYSRNIRGFSDDALGALREHGWPGNVRELENRMKRAVVMSEGVVITGTDLDLHAAPKEGANARPANRDQQA